MFKLRPRHSLQAHTASAEQSDESFLPESQTLQVDAENAYEMLYELLFYSLLQYLGLFLP